MAKKYVYFFGGGTAEGSADMIDLLGGKGANLAEMTNLDLPVPPGFTITTEVCSYYLQKEKFPQGFKDEVMENLHLIEDIMNKNFGDSYNPLLVSVPGPAQDKVCPG